MRADSGFYTHAIVAVCRRMDVRFSITIRQHASLRNLIEAIPETDWTPIPYWMDGAADVAETTYTPFQSEADARRCGFVRRVKPTPGLALFATSTVTDRDGKPWSWRPITAATPRSRTPYDLDGVGLNHMPSGRFAANGAWLAVQVMGMEPSLDSVIEGLAVSSLVTTKTLSSTGLRPGRNAASPCICHSAGLGKPSSALTRLRAIPLPT